MTGGMNAGNQSKYFPMAVKGHEIGNHSKSHGDLTANGANLKAEITDYKYTLESKGDFEVVSFATPYCYYNDAVEAEIAKAHIVNRNCQGAIKYKWDEEPVWERIISIMDEAKAQGLWRAPMGRVAAYYRAHFVIDKARKSKLSPTAPMSLNLWIWNWM